MVNWNRLLVSIWFVTILTGYCSFSQFFSASEIYKKCADAVTLILTPYGFGTGFFINEDGYIITNHHVVCDVFGQTLDSWQLKVKTKNGKEYYVVYVDDTQDFEGLDIAVLKINDKTQNYLPLKPSGATVGEEVVAIGHPNGDFWNQSKGIVSNMTVSTFTIDYSDYYLQHDVPTDEGNSGGPLINAKGQVVGVVTGYKKMYDNKGNLKVQETGKLAIEVSWVKTVLYERGIKYYQHPIVLEGMTEYERQFVELQKDKEKLNRDREELRKERENLDLEKGKFNNEKIEFEKNRLESMSLIEKANIIKKEIEKEKSLVKKRWDELIEKEKELEDKEKRLKEKEISVKRILPNRLAFELIFSPNYLYNQNTNSHFSILNGSVGLFLRFGFVRNYYGDIISSDRIGLVYGVQKIFYFEKGTFIEGFNKDISLAIEFNEIFRIALGRNIRNDYNYFDYRDYNFVNIKINTTGYPISFGFNIAFYSDNKFKLKNYALGLYSGISLSFLRL